ncbi:MAG: translation elongation factor Ts [Polyangiaceae bacterium]|nr:translation elongation factor Ts [Polyangiaceae bacterium]
MADITASMVKELRERTQAGMADCKNALVESGGDMDKAVEVILKKGIVKAAARAGRVASEGEVATWIAPDGKRGVAVEINSQTDFVSRGDDFKGFVQSVVAVASKAQAGTDLGAQTYPGTGKTVDTVRQELVAKTGENCVIRRWATLEAKDAKGFVIAYVHAGGKLAVLLHATGPDPKNAELRAFAENAAMQVAAMSPLVVRREDVAAGDVAKQKEIYEAQLKEEGKPEQAWPKIIEGKVAKWFTEVTLLGQENVWDPPAGSIDKLRQELAKKLGGAVEIIEFVRFSLGEGIEKKQEDLAAEVAKTIGS